MKNLILVALISNIFLDQLYSASSDGAKTPTPLFRVLPPTTSPFVPHTHREWSDTKNLCCVCLMYQSPCFFKKTKTYRYSLLSGEETCQDCWQTKEECEQSKIRYFRQHKHLLCRHSCDLRSSYVEHVERRCQLCKLSPHSPLFEKLHKK